MRRLILCMMLAIVPAGAINAAGPSGSYMSADVDPFDTESLQRGARHFVNYCMACHEAHMMRYNRIGRDLGISDEMLQEYLIFTPDTEVHDTMRNAMSSEDAEDWFGAAAPDLTLYARAQGADRLYTFLNSFYRDDNQPWGVNNLVVSGVSMPHVLQSLQGLPEPVYEERNGSMVVAGLELPSSAAGILSAAEYRAMTRDLTNFLDYVAEPVKAERQRLGFRVIIFLLIFFGVAYLLKREYWKDVH
ncbi:ubiquinol-cytochrome c reductase cytochrome c1 subunit [Natronocella acetinitrilica]|uniref:Ubiquinol-cytochrome c reductase cytochrome c1 subunit n=1 Tax=Natronocella acetinitrilica TaxID=414046 RepID=A0AAE3G4U5_9GAMM|nr:cytochrome c1 [Natronocella acetinitrilica]MCP1673872.1 ubiquinol-cytochrome c reductase cytochrome c1 subunit [Natronocella acetinitrilica]